MTHLKATKREISSSGKLNLLRTGGMIPAVLYGGSKGNVNLSLKKIHLKDMLNAESFLSKVLDLDIDGNSEKVIPRDIMLHPLSNEPIHIDFLRVVKGTKIILEIPVKFINNDKSPGLKKGGVLNIVRRTIELRCPAENIPNEITIDLDNTEIGTSIKISSVKLPNDVMPTITDRDFTVATVVSPTIVVEPEKTAEETPEGEAAVTGEEGAVPAEGAAAEGTEEKIDDKKAAKPAGKSDDKKAAKPGEDKGKAPSKKPEKK
jgi:large subunit ribosomal protein L25